LFPPSIVVVATETLFILLADPTRAARSPAAAAGLDVLRDRVHRVASTGGLEKFERQAVELIHAAGTGVVLTLLACPAHDRDRRLADTLYNAVMQTVLTDAPTRNGQCNDCCYYPSRGPARADHLRAGRANRGSRVARSNATTVT
jgi:hypothetical protein